MAQLLLTLAIMRRWRLASLLVLHLGACGPDPETNETKENLRSCGGAWGDGYVECEMFEHIGKASKPGEVGAVLLKVKFASTAPFNLTYLRLSIGVLAGQALPGQRIRLSLGDHTLAEAPLGGPLQQEASIDHRLEAPQCSAPCELTFMVSAGDVDTDVAVPLEMRGVVVVRHGRNDRPDLTLEVADAL